MSGFVTGKAYMATSTHDRHRKAVVVAAGVENGLQQFVKVSAVGHAERLQNIDGVGVATIVFPDGRYCATTSVELSGEEARRVCDAVCGR